MSFKLEHSEKGGDTFEVFLSSIVADSEKVEKDMLEEAGEKVKEAVVASLNKHRRVIETRYKDRPAMADDVKISTRKGRDGNVATKVQGGKMTGTLWHLVNDGTLHTTGTHFMDDALSKLDGDIDNMWDKVMK